MNIQYYKPKQDSLILFARRRPKQRTRVVIALSAIMLIACFGALRSSKHKSIETVENTAAKTVTVSDQIPINTNNSFSHIITDPMLDNKNSATKSQHTETQDNSQGKSDEDTLSVKDNQNNSKVVTIKSRDSLAKIFARTTISAKDIDAILKSGENAKNLKKLQKGKKITLLVDNNHRLQGLSYPINTTDTLVISRKGNKFSSSVQSKPLEIRQAVAKFTIHGSIATAAKKAGLSSKRIGQLATIFKPNTDINKGNHNGDKLSVIFQDYYLNGKKVRDGEIIAAEFATAANTFQAVRYTDPKGHAGYYAPDGSSLDKRFLIAPVKFTRITSLFNPNRWHPILHRFRHHKGVDYAAPYGTPIKSVGNGTIALLGRKGGYGNTIIIKHDGSYSTLYGHMSKYASGLKTGSSVTQGQIIGYVGSSGLATGPHLHFEFRVNGVHRNPLTVALPNGKAITKAYRNKFKAEAKRLLARLSAHKETQLAANKPPNKDNKS